MNLKAIGRNIRKYRKEKNLCQEQLAEKVELSANYIGMIERGEKLPSLTTLLKIANALETSADMLLADMLYNGYKIKDSLVAEKIDALTTKDRKTIYDIIDIIIKQSND